MLSGAQRRPDAHQTLLTSPHLVAHPPLSQLAERAELWWDDGTAEPEWFVDRGSAGGADGGRPWSLSTGAALAQLAGALTFIGVFIGGTGYLLGDSLRPAAPRWEHGYPTDMRAQFGLPITAAAAEEDE